MVNNELSHHGILGMKWGVRRTDSQLAKTKGNIDSVSGMVKEAKNVNKSVSNIRSTASKKDSDTMSDQELRERVNRMNLEQQYSMLTNNQKTKGQMYVNDVLEVAGSVLAIASSATAIILAAKQIKG